MKLKDIKKIVEKGVKGSGEKQLKVFLKTKKTKEFFSRVVNNKECLK